MMGIIIATVIVVQALIFLLYSMLLADVKEELTERLNDVTYQLKSTRQDLIDKINKVDEVDYKLRNVTTMCCSQEERLHEFNRSMTALGKEVQRRPVRIPKRQKGKR